jgi:hypothetical protein
MSNKIVKQGESISDVVLNYTGNISFWDAILTLNDLKDWNPELTSNVLIPDLVFDKNTLSQLSTYPAHNASVDDILDQLSNISGILAINTIVNSELPPAKETIPNKTYKVRPGETITDVILNSVGTLAYWNNFLNQNLGSDWTPDLLVNENIEIPKGLLIDGNTTRQLGLYPACNDSVNDIYEQIAIMISIMTDLWILKTGFWNDFGIWMDDKYWID